MPYTDEESALFPKGDRGDQSPTNLTDSQIQLWIGFYAVNYLLSAVRDSVTFWLQSPFYNRFITQALRIKGDIDTFSGSSNGNGEIILSTVILLVVKIWDYYTFRDTSSRNSKVLSVLSIIGLSIVILSVLSSAPSIATSLGDNINIWGYTYGAFIYSFSRFWDSGTADVEDGTIRVPIVNAGLGLAFFTAGLSSLLMEPYPSIALYLVVFTDIIYSAGAALLTYRFLIFSP